MTAWIAGLAVLTVLVLGPGWGLAGLVLPRSSFAARLAVAPLLGTGFLYAVAGVLDAGGIPLAPLPVLIGTGVVALGLIVGAGMASGPPTSRALLVVSAASAAALVVSLCAALPALDAVPPYFDGFNHGLAVTQIRDLHTLAPSRVLPSDLLTGEHHVAYYPFGLHLQSAVVEATTGLDVAQAWTLTSLVPAFVLGPLAAGLAAARLVPAHPGVGPAAAALLGVTPVPFAKAMHYGEFALIAGLALIPAGVLVLLEAGEGVVAWAGRSLALAGIVGTHTSQVPVVVLLALAGACCGPHSLRPTRALLRLAVLPGVGSVLLLAPYLAQMSGGYEERVRETLGSGVGWGVSTRYAALLLNPDPPATPVSLALCFWLGAFLLVARRSWPLLLPWGLFALLFVLVSAAPSALTARMTSLWYSAPDRLADVALVCALPVAAVGLADLALRARSALQRRDARGAVTLAAVTVVGAGLLIPDGLVLAPSVQRSYRERSVVDDSARTAFAYLAAHQRDGERVLNQWQDGSPWMYPLSGARPLLPLNTFDAQDSDDRLWLVRHASQAQRDARVDQLLDSFNVRFAYAGQRVFRGTRADLDDDALASAQGWRLVFSRGASRVYERTAASSGSDR